MRKSNAVKLFRTRGKNINKAVTFSSKNKASFLYWSNPDFSVLEEDWTLILNDWVNKKMYLFDIPANSISFGELIPRADKAEKIDIEIFDDNTFTDKISRYSFAKYVVKASSYEHLASEAEKIMWSPSLTGELVRIFQKPQNKELYGIPVHYILCSNNYDTRKAATDILVSALHTNNRVRQGRYGEISISNLRMEEACRLSAIFETYKSGTIVFRFNSNTRRENGVADISEMIIETVCKHIKAYRNEVQVIFCFPMPAEQEKKRIFQYLSGVYFVTLEEGSADKEAAANHLLHKADEDGYCAFEDSNNLTIKAPLGSYAEQYAKENNIPYEAID